jgi:hypothetical protein
MLSLLPGFPPRTRGSVGLGFSFVCLLGERREIVPRLVTYNIGSLVVTIGRNSLSFGRLL